MRSFEAQLPSGSGIEADIARLEQGIRQLKRQYDMFFAGALPHEPIELRHQLEQIIRRYVRSPIQKYALRFHFNAMVNRFNSLSELWAKTMRSLEEGDRRQRSQPELQGRRERLLARCRVHDGLHDEVGLRRLYDRFLDARRTEGNGKGHVSFENFVRGVSAQTRRLQKESGCAEIELRVVLRDQTVQVKARPAR